MINEYWKLDNAKWLSWKRIASFCIFQFPLNINHFLFVSAFPHQFRQRHRTYDVSDAVLVLLRFIKD